MTKSEFKLVLINGFFNFANVLSSAFVGVFIYTYTQSLVMMSIYTIIRIGLFPFFFTIGGKLTRKLPYSTTITTGLVFLTLMMIFILSSNSAFSTKPYLVYIAGALYGVGDGLFWFSINTCNQIAPLADHRLQYLSNVGIFNNFTGIIAPFVSSLILSFIANEMHGYYVIFILVIIMYIAISCISITLKVKSNDTSNFSVLRCLKVSFKDKNWLMVMTSTFFYGFQNSLSLTLTNILIFNATGGSSSLYSNLLILFAFVTIGIFYFMKKKMNDDNFFRFFIIGTILMTTSALALVYINNIYGAIYFGLANAIGSAIYGNPYSLAMLNAIAKYDKSENVTGRVIAKETSLSIGRITGMLMIVLFFYLIGEPHYMKVAVTICSIMPIFVYLIIRKNYNPNK